jgi:peroxiredoxin
VAKIMQRISRHSFHPLRNGFTHDRTLKENGVVDLRDQDWQVRTLAVRDLLRLGPGSSSDVSGFLDHANLHVRQISARVLGLWRQERHVQPLKQILNQDAEPIVRAQVAFALGEIGSRAALDLLRERSKSDPSRDVQHQCELAVHQIEHGIKPEQSLREGYLALDERKFKSVRVGKSAPEISLRNTEGRLWKLSDYKGKKPVLLIWIFADWCPVCHGEFHELIESKDAFQAAGIEVVTIECHDRYRCRVMVGKEGEPNYWFSKRSFNEEYTAKIWWPHLSDPGGLVGSIYGVDPLAFAVHSEFINRPTTIIVDKSGVVRFAYYGTYWGDRPPIRKALEMIGDQQFEYVNPRRLKQP